MTGQELPRLTARLGEEVKLTIAAQRLQAGKARLYWFGPQDEAGA
jgi:hypothetical protein